MNFTPNVKAHFTYVAIEENLTGSRRSLGFGRGDAWGIVTSVEVTPIKGLDIRPIYAFLPLTGSTSVATRPSVAGIGGTPAFTRSAIGGVGRLGMYESRHTIGVDARWRLGPFSLDPTVFYQFGSRDTDNPFGPTINSNMREADISAWFFDVIGGWRLGPLLVEARYLYTSGHRPKDRLSRDIDYYQPLSTDTSFFGAGWGETYVLGIFNGAYRQMGLGIGLDHYGRQQFARQAIYSVTRACDVRAVVSPAWSARSVDTDGVVTFNVGGGTSSNLVCATHTADSAANPQGAGCKGDPSHIGPEVDLGLTWRFAPGLTFDLVGAVLFAGGALEL